MTSLEDTAIAAEVTPAQRNLLLVAAQLAEFAKKVIESGEELAPMLHALVLDPKVPGGIGAAAVSLAPLFVPGPEEMRGPIIADNLKKLGVIAYVMASESWTLALPPEDQQKGELPELERPIREDDRRVSVVSLMGENRVGDYVMGVAEDRGRQEAHARPREPDAHRLWQQGQRWLRRLLEDQTTH